MYTVKSHPVEVSRIVGLQPLIGRNSAVMSPDFGVVIVLENGTKSDWISEKNAPAPAAGDFFVTDKALGVTFVVPAVKFKESFKRSKG